MEFYGIAVVALCFDDYFAVISGLKNGQDIIDS
jgi:hypothetical protein